VNLSKKKLILSQLYLQVFLFSSWHKEKAELLLLSWREFLFF